MGRFLRDKRIKLGLTQRQVADELGYEPQFVCNWERNKGDIPKKKLKKICSIYKITPKDVLSYLVKNYREEISKALYR